ncbi:MAG: MFS transporter [Clostridium sp.]|nr:MFS transporter [Clostridium sp.]
MKSFKRFFILWLTQTFSTFGSEMTSIALSVWAYQLTGSALSTSLLMVSSFAPYVLLSIFAGALSDRWNKKKTMLWCDSFAAMCTVIILILLKTGNLHIWHLYILNALNGCMNTFQQPASEVATTRILPEEYYQKVGILRYIGTSINTIFASILAIAIMELLGISFVIGFDLCTFAVAFLILLFWIEIPEEETKAEEKEPVLRSAKAGFVYLKENPGILMLILFLAAINFTASMYEAAMTPMILSRNGGSEQALGLVKMTTGITMLAGSVLASFFKEPKSRVRVICNTLLFSMAFENFILAFGQTTWSWCIGALLGWITIPLMSTNLDALLRLNIPVEMQGRVYATRNSLQFFTIPVGTFLSGFLVDNVFEPVMAMQNSNSMLVKMFGTGKGSGAGFFFFVIAFVGIATCVYFRRSPALWELEKKEQS